jgi:outer membrane protein
MKHCVRIAIAVALIGALGACPIAGAAELKIGVINVARVFDEYERTKASDAVLEKKGKQKESELEARMGELKKLRQGLELLNEDAREAKGREVEEKSEDLQRFRTSTARDLRRERDKIAKEILGEIQRGIEEYGKANGFSMLLDARSILYGQETLDVTNEVIALLNGQKKSAP